MTRRQLVAIAVWVSSWSLAIAALAIAWLTDLPDDPLPGVVLSLAPLEVRARFNDIGVAVAFVYGPVSALILARRPHPVGVILAIHAVGSGLTAFGVQWGLLGAQHSGLPLWGSLAFAAGWAYVPGTFMTAALPILVTRERVPRWQFAVVVFSGVVATLAFVVSFTQQSIPEPVNPFAILHLGYQARLPALYTMFSLTAVAISVVCSAVLVARWVRAPARNRGGVGWLTLGQMFLTASYLVLVLPEGFTPPPWILDASLIAPVLGQVLYPAAILVVVLGQHLWGVELVVSRIILWALLTISGVALYLVVVLVAQRLLPGSDGIWVLAPLVIALAAQPIRRWLQRNIDVLIYGEGADPPTLLARLGDRIGELEPGAAGLRELADALRRVLRLGSVQVRSATSPLTAAVGDPVGEPIVVPLRSGTQLVGELVVRPLDGQRLDRRTLAVLDEIAGLIAAAVRLVESNIVLEQARTDLMSLRADERRAIRRELHDGLGPALAGIGFGLAAAENLVASQPEKAEALLVDLASDLNRRARDVRDLANEVTSSPLDGATLAEAVRDLADRFKSDSLDIRTDIDRTIRMPAPVQDALYYIAAEALMNAVRHAAATVIEILIREACGLIELEILDDGRGMTSGAEPGVGLVSMRERAEELDGWFDVGRGSSGTVVMARLPLVSSGDRRTAPRAWD